ncbi:unnamed protein product [Effrenium voratum]|uniref:Agmatinase n=1 Tax=Effrenium voratum TaxID=2562239 RepID=A0AA36IL84_9DINO|nr:unnamed protein product [Effrenium voratum]CAJ1422857.1 unnamed protein product [Effrenium voratum]
MRRIHTIAAHINGHDDEPLWVGLMDAGHNPVAKPRYGCRCSADKWQYVCTCYPCLRKAGREEDFDWTPSAILAEPEKIPPQWRSKASLQPVSCSSDLPRPSPPIQEDLQQMEAAGMTRFRLGKDGAIGPLAPSAHPRFGGISTFARLPQLHEVRTIQPSSKATLRLRFAQGAEAAGTTVTLGEQSASVQPGAETCLSVAPEDGTLQVEVAGTQFKLGLWTLPHDRWHCERFLLSDKAVEFDLFLDRQFKQIDIALIGVPFDSGCSFRPGARFGPEAIRSNSRLIRPYMIAQQQRPLVDRQVVDTGDVIPTPFNIKQAVDTIYQACKHRLQIAKRLVVIGGDHTLSYPSIKAVAEKYGRVVLVHFDSHLDTFPPLFGQDVWHGAPFRNCWEEDLLAKDGSTHVGIRATTYSAEDFHESDQMGIATLTAEDVHEYGSQACVDTIWRRWKKSGGAPVYLSVDIDVLDPSVAPGTGTPEYGGLLAHQLLQIIRGLRGLPIVAADVVEVAPAYDHAGITAMAAANILLEQIGLISSCMTSDGFDKANP